MRKSALVVEACPKWASARAGVNESIKSFNEGEAEMKEGEQKMERGGGLGCRWREGGSGSAYLKWRQDSDLRRLSCGSDLCQAPALCSLSACLSASHHFVLGLSVESALWLCWREDEDTDRLLLAEKTLLRRSASNALFIVIWEAARLMSLLVQTQLLKGEELLLWQLHQQSVNFLGTNSCLCLLTVFHISDAS